MPIENIKTLIISVGIIASVTSLPAQRQLDGKVLYDQRQEGEWNVRADLKNFLIIVMPTSPQTSSSPSTLSLLDILPLRSAPSRPHVKRVKLDKNPNADAAQETMHFIESKAAPYQVDITKAKEQLAKLHPGNEEILVATSPSVAFVKPNSDVPVLNPIHLERAGKFSRAFVLTVPADEEFVVTKTEDSKKVVKKDGKKRLKDTSKHSLKLLGAENEQCGPGMDRDSDGICRTYKNL